MHRISLVTALVVIVSLAAGIAVILGGAQPLPDLVISDFQISPANPKPGQEVQLTATITNQGAGPVNDTFVVQFNVGRRTISSRFLPELPAGQSTTVEASWDAEVGEFRLRVIADAFGKIFESNESNNVRDRLIDVSDADPTQSDLVVKALDLVPSNPKPTETAKITATVANNGAGPAPAFNVSFEADGRVLDTEKLEGLAAGQETTLSLDWIVETGERILRVKADPDAKIVETDETNNAFAKTIDFGPPPASCAQQVHLNFDPKSLEQLEDATGLTREALLDSFIPLIKRSIEKDYDGINVRLFYTRPNGAFSTILFDPENKQSILGLAPLDRGNFNKRDTAFVFIGSLVARGSLNNIALPSVAIIIGKVASHELGHALGLDHNPNGGIMNATAETNPISVEFETFKPDDLEYLRRILPMNC